RRGRHLDHAVVAASAVVLAQFDVAGAPLRHGQLAGGVLQQRVQLEADVAVVAVRLVPGGAEDLLRLGDQVVGDLPGDGLVVEPLPQLFGEEVVEPAGLDQVGDDDGVGRGPGGAPGAVGGDFLRVDGVKPELGATGDQGFERRHD